MKKFIIIILAAISYISGCATLTSRPAMTGPEVEYRTAVAFMKENKYNDAVSMYRKIIADSPETQLAADAQYQIALAHALNNNPDKNYAIAIQKFEEFLQSHPADSRALEAQSWITVLTIVLEQKKEYESLKKDCDKLRKSIEELKKLDIQHEQKRTGR